MERTAAQEAMMNQYQTAVSEYQQRGADIPSSMEFLVSMEPEADATARDIDFVIEGMVDQLRNSPPMAATGSRYVDTAVHYAQHGSDLSRTYRPLVILQRRVNAYALAIIVTAGSASMALTAWMINKLLR